jgi:broad specificity phosphatase PhoE
LGSSSHRIDLVRHAQDESARAVPGYHPRPDSPLTELGTNAARDAAGRLTTDYVGIVYSPIHRAHETAKLFAEVSGIPLLAEISHLSEWRPPSCVYGKTPEEYDEDYRRWRYQRTEKPELAYQDGESLLDLHHRASLAVSEVKRLADKHGALLVVSHKVILGVMLHLASKPAEAFQRATQDPWAHCQIRSLHMDSPMRREC